MLALCGEPDYSLCHISTVHSAFKIPIYLEVIPICKILYGQKHECIPCVEQARYTLI